MADALCQRSSPKRLKLGSSHPWGYDMSKVERDGAREERIRLEAVVDAYGAEEQAMGWYYYLQDKIQFPFTATCINKRNISPVSQGTKVDVVGMSDEDDCMREMFVEIVWDCDTLAVPLSQLKPIDPDNEDTLDAIEDWHYWVNRGYEFG
jgi:Calcium binding